MDPSAPCFHHALLAGALAGTTVDLLLFPLDTLKTRLQSADGFLRTGGFRGVYRGVGSALVGSAPGAALFFVTYETAKTYLPALFFRPTSPTSPPGAAAGADCAAQMLAASLGEVAACAVRVPTEVVKQRAQASQFGGSSAAVLRALLGRSAARELYRGWGITVLRDVPFTVVQLPLWEALKAWACKRRGLHRGPSHRNGGNHTEHSGQVGTLESAVYGSVAGAVAAGLTTPLDVLKTRIMLAAPGACVVGSARQMLGKGMRPLFAGFGPRVVWISVGAAIFLGSYQWAMNTLQSAPRQADSVRQP